MSRIKITNETPFIFDELYGKFFSCLKCNEFTIHKNFNYCPNCGVELEIIFGINGWNYSLTKIFV